MTAFDFDTHLKIETMQFELIRRMPPWKKIAILESLNETVKTLVVAGIRQRYPKVTAEEIRRILAETMLGVKLANKVYGHAR